MTAADYGDRHAPVYDRIYRERFPPAAAVETLTVASAGGPVLELGIGTGRLAIPLAQRGVRIEGIEASGEMIDRLRAQPGGEHLPVHKVDLAEFDLPRRDYTVAVCAVSTLFMLPDHVAQQRLFDATARHLRPGGVLFIEAFRPDPTRFGPDGTRSEDRSTSTGGYHHVHSRHDPDAQTITITHTLDGPAGRDNYTVTLRYATDEQLDHMATQAGLTLVERWHDWNGQPAGPATTDPVSRYVKPVHSG